MTDPNLTPVDGDPAAGDQSVDAAADSGDSLAPDIAAEQSGEQELANQLAQANDRVLRAQAEVENVRRRLRREMDERSQFATQPLLTDLLPVIDNLERALESAQQTEHAAGLLEGVKMVASQLHQVLEKHHCPRIAAQGAPFDPDLHEAIAQQPSQEHPPGTVMDVARPGYKLHDRVIRPSQVIVSVTNQ